MVAAGRMRRFGSLRAWPGFRQLCSSAARSSTTTEALNHCVELCRAHDRERFICNLHAPENARPGLFALHAFNYETARIRSSTTEDVAGRGRFAWWRQAIEQALAGEPPAHPVARALAHAHSSYRLTPRYLMQLLDAREADLRVQQPQDMDELCQYTERTAGSLLLLGLECTGVSSCDAAERAAAHAGTALGLATLLRGTAAHAAQGCTYLPVEVTTRHGVNLSAMLRGTHSAEVRDAVAEVADEAVAHLLAARSLRSDIPAEARQVLLPTTVADHILTRLQRHGYSPFATALHEPPGPSLQLALWWRRLTGSF